MNFCYTIAWWALIIAGIISFLEFLTSSIRKLESGTGERVD